MATKNRDISQILDQNTLHTAAINATAFTTTGFRANATHVVATSNSSGQTFGNTIARWLITANSVTVSSGVSPDSNTLGTALGSTTQRWVALANTLTVSGGVSPDSNTLGTALGSTTQRWVITANTVSLSGNLSLPSGGVIDWGSGDVTMTHTTDNLTVDFSPANPGNFKLSTNGAGSAGPALWFVHRSASPATNDLIAYIPLEGKDSANNDQNYGQIWGGITSPTSGAEEGGWTFTAVNAGTNVTQLTTQKGVGIGNAGNPSGGAGCINLGGGQIDFPATQNASGGANVLDDYEEGTWTPTMTFASSTTGITYGTQTGSYTKIGELVTITLHIVLTNNGTGVGIAQMWSLPFIAGANEGGPGSGTLIVGGSAITGLHPQVIGGQGGMNLMIPGAAGDGYGSDTTVLNNFEWYATVAYRI